MKTYGLLWNFGIFLHKTDTKMRIPYISPLAGLCVLAVSSCAGTPGEKNPYLEKAEATMQAVYSHYSVPENAGGIFALFSAGKLPSA